MSSIAVAQVASGEVKHADEQGDEHKWKVDTMWSTEKFLGRLPCKTIEIDLGAGFLHHIK